jgi:hypothetical protein
LHVAIGGLIANVYADVVLMVAVARKLIVAFALLGEYSRCEEACGENEGK